MNFRSAAVLFFCAVLSTSLFGQPGNSDTGTNRPRVIVTDNTPEASPTPKPRKVLVVSDGAETAETEDGVSSEDRTEAVSGSRTLSFGEIRSRIEEAKRQMRVKPLRTAMTPDSQAVDVVRLAFLDWDSNKLDYVVVTKEDFLSKDRQSIHKTERGKTVRIQTIRGNGVNTPVIIYNMNNEPQQPLIVQYPRETGGKFIEMAYYVSTHPGIVTPETVNAGRIYVRNVLNSAREKLREKGYNIQPRVVDMAERLALVEHVDHWRFRNELHPNIYNDVYMLYALNEGQTYRYAVSSAGAGGMVQMIPWTYRMIRSRYANVGLMPDFVEGMRNHLNASQAMLLYMQMTWDDLASNSTVQAAMAEGIATQEQLMAAGYNSNPARLPGYIKRGGAGWTNLIPRETRIYLEIYDSVTRHVPLKPRAK
ncbi:MAG: lytic transglycosylase domain-containing protein [Aridibacter famidurans]|nr:lytic transglycosylase domain-containing protein [Aridibacter famidurans]